MPSQVKVGFIHGTGADQNVELGWVPEYVKIVNLTDGDMVYENWLAKVLAFTSGGTTEASAGDTLTGATSGATATIRQVILDSGSWAGGDAAGWLIFNAGDITGTFSAAETAGLNASGTDDLTVTAAQDSDGINTDTEVAATTTQDTTVTAYVGTASANARGFTIGATVSEDAKLLGFIALRSGPGEGDIDQTTVW